MGKKEEQEELAHLAATLAAALVVDFLKNNFKDMLQKAILGMWADWWWAGVRYLFSAHIIRIIVALLVLFAAVMFWVRDHIL